nr:MAG TPA: Protein of unknown function (DUF1642) [Caudoviricetes sp.]
MEQCDKVILFGYLDGYTYELNGITNYVVALETGERVEIPVGGVMGVDEFVEKDKLKLKDVIARIKKLDLGTQKVWLNEILNELGSDYGTLKYKAGYEQGKLEGEWVGRQLKDAEKIRQLLNKPTVPQIIADYIKYTKDAEWDLQEAMDDVAYEDNKDLRKWFNNNIELFARAWIDGYTVEKEPKYTVKFKATKQYLCNDDLGPHFDPSFRTNFTKSDLEKLDLGWVFDCEGMEVEKVGK